MNVIQFSKHELELLESRIFDKQIILENENISGELEIDINVLGTLIS